MSFRYPEFPLHPTLEAAGWRNSFYLAGELEGLPFFVLWPYYPKRFLDSLSEHEKRCHHSVLDFKEGKNARGVALRISEAMQSGAISQIRRKHRLRVLEQAAMNKGDYLTELEQQDWLAVIPASQEWVSRKRFGPFCRWMCELDGQLHNGFDLIERVEDGEPLHNMEHDKPRILDIMRISPEVKGKVIFLFDDVITSGTAFVVLGRKIREMGAKEVVGLFLARTVRP